MKRDRWQDSSDEEEGVSNRKKVVSQRKNLENISIESSLKKSSQNQPVNEQTLCSNRTTAAHEPIEHQNNNHTKMTGTSFEPVHTMSDINTIEKKSSEAKKDQPKEEEYNPAIYGCRSVEEYEKVSYISQGTYGLVFKARCVRSNEIVALKEIKMTPDARKVGFPITALREINILLALRHPNIIRVREMVIGSSLDRVFMVMDYYDFDLKTCMDMSSQTFSTAEVKQLMLQLLAGIHHMHSNWFLHRDLKTSNILYANIGTLCICDFGMARKFGR